MDGNEELFLNDFSLLRLRAFPPLGFRLYLFFGAINTGWAHHYFVPHPPHPKGEDSSTQINPVQHLFVLAVMAILTNVRWYVTVLFIRLSLIIIKAVLFYYPLYIFSFLPKRDPFHSRS